MNESIRSGMAVLDVSIPTGYWIQQQKLDAYILSKRVRNLQRARFLHNKVIFYFDFVSSRQLLLSNVYYFYIAIFGFSFCETFALTLPLTLTLNSILFSSIMKRLV